MTIALPTSSDIRMAGHRLISSAVDLRPAFGGGVQRLTRLGSRWAMTFQLTLMTYEDSLNWSDLEVEGDTVSLRIPQPGVDTGSPGTPVVDGAGQSGSTLNLRGLTPGYVMGKRWLSVSTGGLLYAYRATASATADGSGDIAIPVRQMIRAAHADGDAVEIANPLIEGFVRDLPANAFDINVAGHVAGLRFTIEERA